MQILLLAVLLSLCVIDVNSVQSSNSQPKSMKNLFNSNGRKLVGVGLAAGGLVLGKKVSVLPFSMSLQSLDLVLSSSLLSIYIPPKHHTNQDHSLLL